MIFLLLLRNRKEHKIWEFFKDISKKTLGETPSLAKTENLSEKVLGLYNIHIQGTLKPERSNIERKRRPSARKRRRKFFEPKSTPFRKWTNWAFKQILN